MIIHGNFYMGTVEARERALDPESIATLPDDVLPKGSTDDERNKRSDLHSLLQQLKPLRHRCEPPPRTGGIMELRGTSRYLDAESSVRLRYFESKVALRRVNHRVVGPAQSAAVSERDHLAVGATCRDWISELSTGFTFSSLLSRYQLSTSSGESHSLFSLLHLVRTR